LESGLQPAPRGGSVVVRRSPGSVVV